jgi:hypothetical protein
MLGALAIGASSLASAVCGEHLSYSVERVPTLPSSVAQRVALRLDAAAPASIEVTALRGTDARGRRHAAAAAALPTLAPGATATVDLLALRPNQVRAAPPCPHARPPPPRAPCSSSPIRTRSRQTYSFALTTAAGCEHALAFATSTLGREPERAERIASLGGPTFALPSPNTSQFPPTVFVNVSNATLMEPGWTWWSNFPGGNNSAGTASRFIDAGGVTRWYTDCYYLFDSWFPIMMNANARCGITGVQTKLKSGNILINWATNYAIVSGTGLSGLVEITPVGAVQHCWVSAIIPSDAAAQEVFIPTGSIRLDIEDLNHDVQELPNGNWMAIAYKVELITTAQCPTWKADQNVTGDELVEFEPYTGKIVKRFSTFDALDVCATYPGVGAWPSPEWIHMNSFDVTNVFAHELNEIVLSSFSLGWVFAVRYADDAQGKAGSLKWIMGRPRPDATAGPGEKAWWAKQPHFATPLFPAHRPVHPNGTAAFQAGQHNANIVRSADGKTDAVVMFDNGAMTGGKSDQGTPSRLLRLDITRRPTSATEGVATVAFEAFNFGWEGYGRSPFLGGARLLPNGNYLGQFGALTQPSCNAPCERSLDQVCMYTRIVEYTPEHELVFAAHVGGRDTTGEFGGLCFGWNGYRAERIGNRTLASMFAPHVDLAADDFAL